MELARRKFFLIGVTIRLTDLRCSTKEDGSWRHSHASTPSVFVPVFIKAFCTTIPSFWPLLVCSPEFCSGDSDYIEHA